MPRKGPAPRRHLVSDPVHHSALVTQLVNKVMLHGKRSLAETSSTTPWRRSAAKTGDDAARRGQAGHRQRQAAARGQEPPRRRGHLPGPRRGPLAPATTLAIRWVVDFARARREKTMADCLAAELMDAANGLGAAVKKRDDMQKMAESNKAFAHYRF